ncbi:LysM peptidoglycan-binding domain-containing protein [Arthrobacter sp. ISL-28]|uniref:LysM peptidoglycan-binding domain-containing protein n=1 Tax=Arthrobacter sp. ISL-28 TaxID=2819108 RepID=UPI001BEC5B90|nr:LysM peptidoglycan-binding domain-containing protein [Arthrobacter sp. ISL-28]MBT2521129.1 LysM peptidoglycan-binding domain-containing protein [Arthrobacter sp. ISL-28]
MSRKSISARHRATPTQSIALQGLSHSLKSNASSLVKPAAAAAAVSGLVFGVGAPAHAGAYAPEGSGSASIQAQAPAVQAPAVQAPAPAPAVPGVAAVSHTVVPGDTLGAIAARHGVDLNTVLSANGLSLSSVIYPGDQILIPGPGQAAAAPQTPPQPAPQTVPAAPKPAGMGIYHASASVTPKASPAPASGVGAALVASARAQLGATQDCTILVEQALRSVGKSVGDLAPAQFHQYGTPVSTPQAGDLMISAGHVAIYIGGGQAISSGMNGVNETIVHPTSWLTGSSYVRVNA